MGDLPGAVPSVGGVTLHFLRDRDSFRHAARKVWLASFASVTSRLRRATNGAIVMHVSTSPNIDKALLERARTLTGLREEDAVLNAGLEALIARESARRLIELGGTEQQIRPVPRRRQRPSRDA